MKTRTRRRVSLLLAICMVVTPEMLLAQQPATKEAMRQQAIRLIPQDATAGLVVYPHSMLSSPSMHAMPVEVLSALGKQELGLDPLDVAMVVGAVQIRGPGVPDAALALKFRAPFSLEDLSPKVLAGMNREQWNDKPFLKSDNGLGIYMSDDTTLLFGTEGMIRKMLEMDGDPAGDVHKHLNAGAPADVQLVVALASIRGLLNAQIQQVPMLPGGLERLKQLPDHTEALELRIDSTPLSGEVALHAQDAEAADEIEKIFARALQTGKVMAQEAAHFNIDGDGEVEVASRAYADRMIDMCVSQLTPRRDGTKVMLGGRVGSQAEVAVIGMLVALLLPAVQAAREAARRATSLNKGKQIMLAMLNHEAAYGQLPAQAIYDEAEGKPLLSWRVKILPFIEETQLYEEFHLDEPWDSPHNKKLIARMPMVFATDGENPTEGKTHFLGVAGEGDEYMFSTKSPEGRQLRQILDGTSNSIAVVEADEAVIWTKPDDFLVDKDNPAKGLGGLRVGNIFNAMFCDGHVSVISKDVDAVVLKALFTVQGGEAVRAP